MRLLIGTYTEGTGSAGIYLVDIDEEGILSPVGFQAHAENPSFLLTPPGSGMLYAVSELKGTAAVTSYRIGADGSLSFLLRTGIEGSGLCYLSAVNGSALMGACYLSGNVFHAVLDAQGLPSGRISYFSQSAEGALTLSSRAHCLVPDPRGRYAVGANLGLDRLFVYRLEAGGPHFLEEATVRLPEGEGPRHLVFHPTLPTAYLCTEYGNHLYVFSWDGAAGSLSPLQCLDTLPSGAASGQSFCADVRISADGSFLLASNRGNDSVAVFAIGGDGLLRARGHLGSSGSWPRGFALVQKDRFLVVANQREGTVVSIPFGAEAGLMAGAETGAVSVARAGEGAGKPVSVCPIPAPSWICPLET